MSNYGQFKYGSSKYGVFLSDFINWELQIDWNNDGIFDHANEALRMSYLRVTRGRDFLINQNNTGFEPVREGEFVARLDNSDGRFDPYNTSSPLYPYVLPGSKFRIRVHDNATNTIYPVLFGYITDIRPNSGKDNLVTIKGVDAIQLLREQKPNIAIQTNIDIDNAILAALNAVSWADGTNLADSPDVMPYWWLSGNSLYTELVSLADASLGQFFIAADGTATYYDRNTIPDVAATITDADVHYGDISLPQPWDNICNDISVYAYPRTVQSLSELWRLQDVPYVANGASITIVADHTYSGQTVPATSVTSPASSTDYTMHVNANGTGGVLTSGFTVTTVKYATKTYITLTNNSGSNGYITLLKLRGTPATASSSSIIQTTNSSSVTRYRQRKFTLNSSWLQDTNIAKSFSIFLASYLGGTRYFPTVRIIGKPSIQFALDLFDRATLNLTTKNISGTFSVGKIEHEWNDRIGNVITSTFRFESLPSLGGSYWTFSTNIGTTSIFGL